MEKKMELSAEAYARSMSGRGNFGRIQSVLRRAKAGEALTIGFIGGSITQGSLASDPKLCYAARVFDWWEKTFPGAAFTYVNAGIGGTTSQFGVARAEDDLLRYQPDFVIVEFSVNDESTEHFKETYEGLVRRIYGAEHEPAVLIVHNMRYDSGASAQLVHAQIGRYYRIPCVSMLCGIFPELLAGRLAARALTEDGLHPNDRGHELAASVICHALEAIRDSAPDLEPEPEPAEPCTKNRYEHSVRYRNEDCAPELSGFAADGRSQEGITDVFKKGWYARQAGARFALPVTGRCIAIQYRKAPACHAPLARVLVDSEEVCILDGNFPGGWGDSLELATVYEADTAAEHRVELVLEETGEELSTDFYLASVITAE